MLCWSISILLVYTCSGGAGPSPAAGPQSSLAVAEPGRRPSMFAPRWRRPGRWSGVGSPGCSPEGKHWYY